MPQPNLSGARRMGVFILFLTLVIGGCSGPGTSSADLIFVNPSEGEALVQGRRRMLGLGDQVRGVWVDPRNEREFAQKHIPGSINIPFQDISRERRRLEGFSAIVVVGADYNDPKAEGMSKRLMELGFTEVYTLRGGLRAWEAAGHPIEGEGDGEAAGS